jgi:hypothetical protein
VAWDRNTPWRQGKIINAEDCVALKLCDETEAATALVVVASHDCDISQSHTIEPNVEIIVGKIVSDLDGNFSHAKNARCLQLSFEGKMPQVGEFEATRKTVISKAELVSFKPSANHCLSPENTTIFQLWLASRYRRSAFPDEFENRLKATKIAGKIAKIVKPHSKDISGVFFDVDDGREVERIGSDDTYQLGITILYPSEPNPEISEKTAMSVEKEIRAVFAAVLLQPLKKWQHIELRYIDVMSEDAITYRQFKQLKRWRLDHMSLVASPQQAIVVE